MICDQVYWWEIYCRTCETVLWSGHLSGEPTAALVNQARRQHICIGGKT